MFTVRYGLIPCIEQITFFVFKRLNFMGPLNQAINDQIWGSHGNAHEASSLPVCYTVLIG